MERKIISISELVAAGYPRNYLKTIVHIPGQDFAYKMSNGKTSKWMFKIDKFENFEKRKIRQSL